MSLPDVAVEIALTTDPLTRPGESDWTRVDSVCPVRSVSTRRGAGLRDGSIVAGSASVVLDNRSGDLFPGNTAGAFFPDLTLRRRVRVSLTQPDDGIAYPDPDVYPSSDVYPSAPVLFTGFVDRLPVSWDLSASDGTAELGAVDLLSVLAQVDLPPSVLHQTIMDLDPVAYWPLSETQGTFADDVAGAWDGAYRRPVGNTTSIMPYDDRGKATCGTPATDDLTGQAVTVDGFTGSSTQTVSYWVYQDADSGEAGTLSNWYQCSASTPVSGLASTPERLIVGVSLSSVAVAIADGTTLGLGLVDINMYGLHHIAVTVDTGLPSYPVTVYIDGVEALWQQADPLNPVDPFASVDVDAALAAVTYAFMGYGISFTSSLGFQGTIGEVCYWNSALSGAEILSIYEAGVQPWTGDTTGSRLGRILDAVGVDAGDRDIDTGVYTCGPTSLGGNALEYLRKIAATERGALFVSGDGKITYRQQFANDPTPADVIGDAGCPTSAITVDYSLDRMVNVAEVTAENGITHTFTDSAARSTFGPLGANRNTLHSSPSGVKSFAAELVARNKDLRTQITGVQLESRRSDVPSAVTVGSEIGDAYTVEYAPPGLGSPEQVLVRVEAISHQIVPGSWKTTLDVDQQVVLPDFTWDTADQGWDQSVWA